MNTKRFISGRLFRTLLGVAILSCSCIREGFDTPAAADDSTTKVEIQLYTPVSDASATRALSASDELRVDDVTILFFPEESMRLHSVSEGRRLSVAPDSDGRTLTFETNFSVERQLAEKSFTCIVLANVAGIYDEQERLSWRGLSYEELRERLVLDVTDRLYTSSPVSMIMWGIADQSLVPATPNARLSVPMLRSVARVDVEVDELVGNFTLTDAYVYKPNDSLGIMPLLSAYSKADRKVSAHSVPSTAAALGEAWHYAVADNRIDYSIYLPEADVIMGGNAVPGDERHLDRCAVVVGGLFGGSDSKTYYRVDFKTGGTDPSNTLMDVLRNHRYILHITKVYGRGESDPDTAYEARTAAITADIVPWTDNNDHIVFDGANWASVKSKELHLLDGAGLTQLLELLSNVEPSQWTMELSSDGEITCAETTASELEGRYFSVTKPADIEGEDVTQGGNIVITTLTAYPASYDADGNEIAAEPRMETLTIRIAKLELVVRLYQHVFSSTSWDDGGEIENGF